MTKRAIDWAPADEWDVIRIRQVASMIELQRVGFAKLVRNQTELGMILRKTREGRREAIGGTRCFESFPTDIRTIIECCGGKGFSLFRGSRHLMCVAVTTHALRVAQRGHRPAALMLLVTRRAGAIVNDIRLMERMAHMAVLAPLIDAFIAQLQGRAGQRLPERLMTLRAVAGEPRMMLRDRAGVVHLRRTAKEKPRHDRAASETNNQDGEKAQLTPVMGLAKIVEVALETLGNLFLRPSVERHSSVRVSEG